MNETIFSNGFKKQLDNELKEFEIVTESIIYNPSNKDIRISFVKDNIVNNDILLTLNIDLYKWYKSNIKIDKLIDIINTKTISYITLNNIITILVKILITGETEINTLLKYMSIINEINNHILNNDETIVQLIGNVEGYMDELSLESYIIYKDDIPYFKLISDTTAIISCKTICERFISIK